MWGSSYLYYIFLAHRVYKYASTVEYCYSTYKWLFPIEKVSKIGKGWILCEKELSEWEVVDFEHD